MVHITGFINAIRTSFKAVSFISDKKLSIFYFYTFCFWVLIWVLSFIGFAKLASEISDNINHYFSFENIPDKGSWLSFIKPFLTGYFSVILALFIKIILWYISSIFIKYIVLILLSPLFSILSEMTEEKANNTKFLFSTTQLVKDIFRGIKISLRNMFLEYVILLGCFIITLVFPPLGLITAPVLIMSSWYFVGYTMLDYNFERHKMNISQSNTFTRNNFGLTCGIGMIYSIFLILPVFIGVVIGPVITVATATLSFLQITQNKTENSI